MVRSHASQRTLPRHGKYDAFTMPPLDATSAHRPARRHRRTVAIAAAALACGLLLRLFFIARFPRITGDAFLYGDFALNWLRHGVYGLSQDPGQPPRPSLIRLPGYPLFLALCFYVFGAEHYGEVMYVQAIVDLGTCWLISRLAARLFGERAALPALWLAALCPFTANYVATGLTETLTLFFLALSFYTLTRWFAAEATLNRWLVALAGALAYSILLRPEQGLLAAAIVPAVLYLSVRSRVRHPFRPAVILSLLTVLPLVPWTVRNQRTFGVIQPLAPRFANDPGETNPAGFQRWFRSLGLDFALNETVYWPFGSDAIRVEDLPSRAFDSEAQRHSTAALLATYNESTTSTPALDAQFDALASQRIHAAPFRYFVVLPVGRLLNMMFRPRLEYLPAPLEWWHFLARPRMTLFAVAYATLNFALFAAAALAFRRRRILMPCYAADSPILWAMLGSVVLRMALLLTIDNSEPRYTLEFFPILLPLAGALLATSRSPSPL